MARQAVLKLGRLGGSSVLIRLTWTWMPYSNDLTFWWCEPGYIAASSGSWEASALGRDLVLIDDDGKRILHCMNMHNDYTGYPFTDLKGDSGGFQSLSRFGILWIGDWEFLEV